MSTAEHLVGEVRYQVEAAEIDRYNVGRVAGEIRRILNQLEVTPEAFVLDCGAVTFVDSAALAAVIRLHRRLTSMGTRLVIANANPSVRRPIETLGLTDRLGVR